jgi:chromosomal replication initiator protein
MAAARVCPLCGQAVGRTDALVSEILAVVGEHYGLAVSELTGRSVARRVTGPRQVAMYLAAERTGFGRRAIGKIFGRDHSTVTQATQSVVLRVGWDERLRDDLLELRCKLDA